MPIYCITNTVLNLAGLAFPPPIRLINSQSLRHDLLPFSHRYTRIQKSGIAIAPRSIARILVAISFLSSALGLFFCYKLDTKFGEDLNTRNLGY